MILTCQNWKTILDEDRSKSNASTVVFKNMLKNYSEIGELQWDTSVRNDTFRLRFHATLSCPKGCWPPVGSSMCPWPFLPVPPPAFILSLVLVGTCGSQCRKLTYHISDLAKKSELFPAGLAGRACSHRLSGEERAAQSGERKETGLLLWQQIGATEKSCCILRRRFIVLSNRNLYAPILFRASIFKNLKYNLAPFLL